MYIDKVDEMERNLIFSYTIVYSDMYVCKIDRILNYNMLKYQLQHFIEMQKMFLLKFVRRSTNNGIPTHEIFTLSYTIII